MVFFVCEGCNESLKKNQVDKLEKASEEEAQRLEREREDMEATLHEVASDLGRLALLYRTQGKAPHAVPLYMTALAIYEKTLGPDHPEVAKDLVNLGNAFCDQNQHSEAVPLYLRALAIDQAALGDDHPEVCACDPLLLLPQTPQLSHHSLSLSLRRSRWTSPISASSTVYRGAATRRSPSSSAPTRS